MLAIFCFLILVGMFVLAGTNVLRSYFSAPKMLPPPERLTAKWRHHKGGIYTSLHIANVQADRFPEFPSIMVYQDQHGNLWARPLDDFLRKFKPVINSTISSKELIAYLDKRSTTPIK